MNPSERKAAFSLASIYAFRMLGLFMILPVFALYADHYTGATATLVGIALGIYGLTQACLQIPFGMLSDRFGRKVIIASGLGLFVLGSLIAALSTSITGIVIGRALQGAGAVGSATIALLADLTQEEQRTKAMAVIGLTIGISFSLAMVLGPIISAWFSLSGIFWLTALLGIFGIVILLTWTPTPQRNIFHRDAEPVPTLFKNMLCDPELLRLDFGIMALHAMLMASFVVLPLVLENADLLESKQWHVYLPVFIFAFIAMTPLIILAEKKRLMKPLFVFSIGLLCLTQISLAAFHHSILTISLCLFIFFTAFTFLEASLPSLISKRAPAGSKGTAMGIYSSSQFLGIFLGGLAGGWLHQHFHVESVFVFCALIALLWFILAIRMQQPRYLTTKVLNVGSIDEQQAQILMKRLLCISGVAEAVVIAKDGIAHLKIDRQINNNDELMQFSTVMR